MLEIGLGFGTVGQILADRGARYHGADIAAGPVSMMRDRLRLLGRPSEEAVLQASALELPWKDASFDVVVSIGCLHHTGDLPQAVSEVHRVLTAGGTAFVMLYNAHSFRQLIVVRREQLRAFRARRSSSSSERVRAMYDTNTAGEAAPHTDFVSRRGVRRLFGAFSERQDRHPELRTAHADVPRGPSSPGSACSGMSRASWVSISISTRGSNADAPAQTPFDVGRALLEPAHR